MIETTVLISVIGCALSVAAFFIGRTTAAKEKGKEDGALIAGIDYIKESLDKQEKKLDSVVENYSELKSEIGKLKERLHALEQKVEYLHGGSKE